MGLVANLHFPEPPLKRTFNSPLIGGSKLGLTL
jgi:hypothetical protein